ncbi:LemA family protein [Bdellovibrio sp. HCB2-146]|uniref:LemA family protein n=1 Tax=Bdellovibrio sp. HCB2-146 TaxID=3394362 RepID=UPI0039BD2658
MNGLVLGVVLVAAILFVVSIFNKLVRLKNNVKNSFAQIDVQLKRRYDLIPNLVETAKAYMQHEQVTLEKVIQARNQAMGAYQAVAHNPTNGSEMKNLVQAEGMLGQALGQLRVVMESYPDLKANTTMNQLMEELTSTENKISYARQAYNDGVMDYNNQCEMFPSNIVAKSFNFQMATNFEITNSVERETVKVSFT